MPFLSIQNIHKAYSGHKANRGISLDIPSQNIFGILGPNGAGKTTLIRIITQIIGADEGTILVEGEPLKASHQNTMGYMPEERGLYKKMKVEEQLIYLGRLKGLSKKECLKRIDAWLDKFEMQAWRQKYIEELSKGMQQKIQFISTVLHEPKLLILDEPFSGLDPINTNLIKQQIFELKEKGTTIIFSTHRMEQVEEICQHIALINAGKKVLQGKVNDLQEQFKQNLFSVKYANAEMPNLPQNFSVETQEEGSITFKLEEGQNSNDLLNGLLKSGFEIKEFVEILPSINEIFISQVEETTE